MATTLDRLKFLISADASSAISAFEQVAASADRNFEMASDRLDKVANKMVGFGATALAGAGIVGRQFYRITTGASDLNETVNKTRVVFDDAFTTVDKFARGAAKSIGTSRRQALDAASSFGLFGKSAGKTGEDLAEFSTEMVTLSADLASFFNTSIPDASQALSAALRGESEPIRRYNVLLNDAALKARAMSMAIYDGKGPLTGQQKILAAHQEILAQTTDAQGDFIRTSDGLANSQRTLDANIQDLKDSIGEAFLPVLQNAVGATGDVVKQFNNMNQSADGVIGKMALFGTAAVAVTGALALISGLALKARSALTDAEGELNNLGKTAKVVSYALATLAIAETVGVAVQQLGGFARDTEGRLNRLLTVMGKKGSTEEITTAFAELADQLKNADTSVTGFFKQFGKAIRVAGADTDAGRIAIEYLDEAFSQIAARSPKLAQQIIDALKAQAEQLDKTKDTYKDNMMLVKRYQDQLDGLKSATEALTDAEEENDDANEDDDEEKRKREEAARRLAERLKQLRQAILDSGVEAQKKANEYLKEARQRYDDYHSAVTKAVTSVMSLSGALDRMTRAQQASNQAAADAVSAQDKVVQAQERLDDATRGVADANNDLAEARRALDEASRPLERFRSEDIAARERAIADATARVVAAETKVTEATAKETAARTGLANANKALATANENATKASADASKGFLTRLQEEADEATAFGTKLMTLMGMGLKDQGLLQQILDAGADAGGKIADELIRGGTTAIQQAEALSQSVRDAAKAVADRTGLEWYQAGVDNATQLVNGVDSILKKYKVKLQSKNLTEKQLKALRKQFKVAVDFEFVSREFAVPEAAEGGIVRARSGGQLVRVAEAGQDEAIIPLPNGMRQMAAGQGPVIHINVESTDPQAVVDALRRYVRQNGSLGWVVA